MFNIFLLLIMYYIFKNTFYLSFKKINYISSQIKKKKF